MSVDAERDRGRLPGTVALGIATAAPVTAGALAAGGMLWAGDPRLLSIDVALPGAILAAGVAVSLIPAGVLLTRRIRSRAEQRQSDALQAARADAAATVLDQERQQHRRFLARLDHELKNPLTAIRATAAAARDDSSAAPWQTVDAQANKLGKLVRDLRKLAELETRPLDIERVDLEQVIAESIDALAQQSPASGTRVAFSVTRVPWPVPALSADLDLIALAVDNVLGNAAKYSTAGPIEVRLREEGGWAVIDVADAGRGIPAAELPLVFDELARAQNARDVSGSGIGLTLVATIMRLHGGDVSIRSVENAGTVVTLRLPITR